MKWLKKQRVRYTLHRHPIPHAVWKKALDGSKIFTGLSAVERAYLRELATLLLHRKSFSAVQGLELNSEMRVTIAAQACLLILKLGIDYYDGWVEVLIYPDAFLTERDNADENGLVSHQEQTLIGESWLRGPVILSWHDVQASHPGRNVVVHEFAHKLDMLNGRANGMPPLHSGMARRQWTRAFSDAFDHLARQLKHHHRPNINAYAASSPAEFFAVTSEYFFTNPHVLRHHYPAVYDQLGLFYRQDPASRISPQSVN